jgi:hypothetical protein
LQILAVEDFGEFLELAGAAPMSDTEVCRWLRRSILRSLSKGYHNPRFFAALAEKKRSARAREVGGGEDPEDFGLDTRAKETKAQKKARRAQVQALWAQHSAKQKEQQRALWWARTIIPRGCTWPRQTCIFADRKEVQALEETMGSDGQLQERVQGALPGYKLLGCTSLAEVKTFPTRIWLGLGCIDCKRLAVCETSGRCMPCCRKLATEEGPPQNIKGLTGPSAPAAHFTAFQAQAVQPVTFEMHLEVKFDGLVADLSPLRAALADDLTVKQPIRCGSVFSRVSRAGKILWEKSPEQVLTPGCQLVHGFQGVTDAVFRTRIRGMTFVLLSETMHSMKTLADLDLLKMARTYCSDHKLRDEKTKEIIWDKPCKNCRGILRLQFRAPKRYAERMAQLEGLQREHLAQRASLCGLSDEASRDRAELMKLIVKSEGIIR